MIKLKTYQYRLKLNDQHLPVLAQYAGCQRFIWNYFLDLSKKRLDQKMGLMSYCDMARLLTELKREEKTAFLKDVHSQTLQQTLKNLDRSLRDCFQKKKGFPKFKKKGVKDSFRFPQNVKVVNGVIGLPKLGWLECFYSRPIEGEICNATVSRRGKHWYVSIQTEQEMEKPTHPSTSAVGIDLGVVRFATLSTGAFFAPSNSFSRLEQKLAQEQKKLSRKIKGSKNRRKQLYKLQQVHIRIANARKDYLHKLSTKISKSHAVVVMEDLDIQSMSARRSDSKPAAKKRALNRRILDAGWYEFRRQLAYKLEWLGGRLHLVDPRNTSRTCPECSHICAENRPTQSEFRCQRCEYSGNADDVAARNILMAVGHTVSAYGDTKPVAA